MGLCIIQASYSLIILFMPEPETPETPEIKVEGGADAQVTQEPAAVETAAVETATAVEAAVEPAAVEPAAVEPAAPAEETLPAVEVVVGEKAE